MQGAVELRLDGSCLDKDAAATLGNPTTGTTLTELKAGPSGRICVS